MAIEFNRKKREITLQEVVERIEHADHMEIDAMIDAVRRRYSRVFPDWDVMFMSVHSGNEAEAKQQVEWLIQTLRKQYLE